MGARRGVGLLVALLVAIFSFIIIYFFIPQTSEKYFGASFRSKGGVEFVQDIQKQVTEKAVQYLVEKAAEGVANLKVDVSDPKSVDLSSYSEVLKDTGIDLSKLDLSNVDLSFISEADLSVLAGK